MAHLEELRSDLQTIQSELLRLRDAANDAMKKLDAYMKNHSHPHMPMPQAGLSSPTLMSQPKAYKSGILIPPHQLTEVFVFLANRPGGAVEPEIHQHLKSTGVRLKGQNDGRQALSSQLNRWVTKKYLRKVGAVYTLELDVTVR